MVSLKEYLRQTLVPDAARGYQAHIDEFVHHYGSRKAKRATYRNIVDHIAQKRQQAASASALRGVLYALKHYYYWLNATGKRKDHPCRNLHLKDKKSYDLQLQDLFTPEELEKLMEHHDNDLYYEPKNKAVISLMIYQGLRSSEIKQLRIRDIDLNEGTIYTKGARRLNSRTLKLTTKQIMLFYRYLGELRPKLKASCHNDHFIVNRYGQPPVDNGSVVSILLRRRKYLFPGRKLNNKTVRMSVIANKFKEGWDLYSIQRFAGHKNADSTRNYSTTDIEELKTEVEKYHPLQ